MGFLDKIQQEPSYSVASGRSCQYVVFGGRTKGKALNLTLHRLVRGFIWSGIRVSNSPPTAWEAVTLPDELIPHR